MGIFVLSLAMKIVKGSSFSMRAGIARWYADLYAPSNVMAIVRGGSGSFAFIAFMTSCRLITL